jgi:hypothetical protein
MADVRRKGGLLRSILESRHATREWLLGLLPSKIRMACKIEVGGSRSATACGQLHVYAYS